MHKQLLEDESLISKDIAKKRSTLQTVSKKAQMEEAITTKQNYLSQDKPMLPHFSRRNPQAIGRDPATNRSDNSLIANFRIKEVGDKKTEIITARDKKESEVPAKSFRDIFIKDEIAQIFETLEISIQLDAPVVDQLKLLEGKFEQLALEYRTIKSEFPDLFVKLRREFYNSLKGKTIEQLEKEKAIENEQRVKRNFQRAMIGSKNKHYRKPLEKNYLVSRKIKHQSSDNLVSSTSDQNFLIA